MDYLIGNFMMGIVEFIIILLKIIAFLVIISILLVIAGGLGGLRSVLLLLGGFMLSMGVLIFLRSIGFLSYSTMTGLACLVLGVLYLLVSLLVGLFRVEGRFLLIASVSLILYFIGEVSSYYGLIGFSGFTLAVSSFLVLTGLQVILETSRRYS